MQEVEFEGKTYYYEDQPEVDNYKDGDAFYVTGKDEDGNDVEIVWEYVEPDWYTDALRHGYVDDLPNDLSDFADWDNPVEVNEI